MLLLKFGHMVAAVCNSSLMNASSRFGFGQQLFLLWHMAGWGYQGKHKLIIKEKKRFDSSFACKPTAPTLSLDDTVSLRFRAAQIRLWLIYLQLIFSRLLNNREAEQKSVMCDVQYTKADLASGKNCLHLLQQVGDKTQPAPLNLWYRVN